MKYEEIVADLKAGKYAPIYFLSGEESYFLDDIATRIEKNALTEDEKAFNQTILYGNDVSMTTVTDTARRFPMMSQRQVVIVKEAQNIRDFENLLPYIDHLQPTTILVFLYKNKKPDKRKGVFKKLSSSSHCIYFESVQTLRQQDPGLDYFVLQRQEVHDFTESRGYSRRKSGERFEQGGQRTGQAHAPTSRWR